MVYARTDPSTGQNILHLTMYCRSQNVSLSVFYQSLSPRLKENYPSSCQHKEQEGLEATRSQAGINRRGKHKSGLRVVNSRVICRWRRQAAINASQGWHPEYQGCVAKSCGVIIIARARRARRQPLSTLMPMRRNFTGLRRPNSFPKKITMS
jgi:hypothetical protein